MEIEAHVVVVEKKKKNKSTNQDDTVDDEYVRPDKCELCGISFIGTHASQWNRYNIKVHTNSKACQNTQRKNLKANDDADGQDSIVKTPKEKKKPTKITKTKKNNKATVVDPKRDAENNDMIMLEIICGHVFFRVQDFLDAYKKQETTNIDAYEEAKDVVLKILGGEDNELKDSVSFNFILN
jgi:hypothetical protein